MKSVLAASLICLGSIAPVIASTQANTQVTQLDCTTVQNQFHGFTSAIITLGSGEAAVLKGYQSGGEAQFMREIGPYNVNGTVDGDVTIYSTSDQSVEIRVISSTLEGHTSLVASFKEGNAPAMSMTCKAQ